MTTVDWLVILGAIAAIIWVNWYFFAAEDERPQRDEQHRH
jgi:hypothetical protein